LHPPIRDSSNIILKRISNLSILPPKQVLV